MSAAQVTALGLLRSHPDKWIRPGNELRLLAYLLLALQGLAVAAEDESGFRFRLASQPEMAA
jgi:hypothetical protein